MTEMKQTETTKSLSNGWTKEEVKRLGKALTFAYDNQNSYGQPLNLNSRVTGWKFILSDDYTLNDVLKALKIYMTNNDGMPTPSDIIKILSPPKKLVSYAQYSRAKDQWAKENYKPFSYYADIVREYESQYNETQKEPFEITGDIKKLLEVHNGNNN